MNIKLVLSNDFIREAFTTILSRLGSRVSVFSSSKIACKELIETDTDLLLIDLQTLITSGDMLESFKKKHPDLEILLFLNFLEHDSVSCLDKESYFKVDKIVDSTNVIQKVEKILKNKEGIVFHPQ